MNIVIIGYGFVGKAIDNALKKNVNVTKIDPKLDTNLEAILSKNHDFIFICLPTPMNENNKQDISTILNTLKFLKQNNIDSQIIIKSTVLPSNMKLLQEECNSLVYNPEFLREKFAKDDFINAPIILFGGNEENCQKASEFYKNNTNCILKKHTITDIISASLIKYSINSFLATKVVFFNELHEVFVNSGSQDSWENIIKAISTDSRIGNSHMQVPGHDERKGFGGACFPKDTSALYDYSKEINSEFKLLKKAIKLNNELRAEYNDPLDREKEQNINFNKRIEE